MLNLLEQAMSLEEYLESKAVLNNLELERGNLFEGLDSYALMDGKGVVVNLIKDEGNWGIFFSPTKLGLEIAEGVGCFVALKKASYDEELLCGNRLAGRVRAFGDKINKEGRDGLERA